MNDCCPALRFSNSSIKTLKHIDLNWSNFLNSLSIFFNISGGYTKKVLPAMLEDRASISKCLNYF